MHESPSRPEQAGPQVLHEAADWLVLHKPAGWHSVAKADSTGEDVERWLRAAFDWARELPEGGLVHRLDQDTSGCLMAAKSVVAQERWRSAFQSGKGVEKIYLALAGRGLAERGEFRLYFTSRHKRSRKITVRNEGESRYEGRCQWRIIGRQDAGDLLEVRILGPGRRHQIRAGLATRGHPIVGDELYGGGSSSHGLALHAWKLTVDNCEVIAPPPTWVKVGV